MALAVAKTTADKDKQIVDVKVEFFHIDMIPDAMENMGWPVAAQLMRHWFSIKPAFAFDLSSKKIALNTDATTLSDSQINSDIVKMSWAMKYEQVNNGIIELTRTWKSIKGIERLNKQLKKNGFITDEYDIFLGHSENVRELDANAQVNILTIGNKLDAIDEWYGAMGVATLKVCVRGNTSKREGKTIFTVDKLGFYIKDTYDFADDGIMPEPLGIWSKNGVLSKKDSAIYMSLYLSAAWPILAQKHAGFVPVFNTDFRKWQSKHNSGGDFVVFSDILWLDPLPKDRVIIL